MVCQYLITVAWHRMAPNGLSKQGKLRDVELLRSEIDASWGWRNGNIDETVQKKVEKTIAEF